jgi:hypothetical protein
LTICTQPEADIRGVIELRIQIDRASSLALSRPV